MKLIATFFTFAVSVLSVSAHAVCPFNADAQGTVSGTATTDGLLFIRYALGITSGTALGANATQGGTPPADIANYIANPTNAAALDIDGDGKFTPFDAQIIARYLMGFRSDSLSRGLLPPEFAKRFGANSFQSFIESGCTGASDAPDPRIAIWNAMNAQLALGTAAGVTAARVYLTDTAVDNIGPVLSALISDHAAIVASYSVLLPRVVGTDYAEYWVSRPIVGGVAGEREIFIVTFLRSFDGVWRIDSM